MKVHATLVSLLINASMNVDAQTTEKKSSSSDEAASHGRTTRTFLRHGHGHGNIKMDGSSAAAAGGGGRSLQVDDHAAHFGEGDHSSMHFVESVCNHMLDVAECTPWSTYFNGADMTQEIKIPSVECAFLSMPLPTSHSTALQWTLVKG